MRYTVNVEGAVCSNSRYLLIVRGGEESHAAGLLSLIGGKVDEATPSGNVLESTLVREIQEEVGITIENPVYVHSTHFLTGDGDQVIDVVFLCHYVAAEPRIDDPGEVAEIVWLSAQQVQEHPDAPVWTRDSIQRAEELRIRLGW